MRLHLLKTILWLRWKLSVNKFVRAGAWLRFVMIVLTIFAVLFIGGVLIGGFLLGRSVMADTAPENLMLVIDGLVVGFLFFWGIGVIGDIQRSESIDLQRLLHLPVKLFDAFVVNFMASHFSLSLLLIVPAITGLTLGLVFAGRESVLVLLPLFFAFVFAVSSWTYCLRGWLVQLMVNPRRRRSIVIGLTLTIIVLAQTPNLFFNVYLRGGRDKEQKTSEVIPAKMEKAKTMLKAAHYYLPPLWVGLGTARAQSGNWWPAVGAFVCFGAIGGAGLRRAYRATLNFYQGKTKPQPARVKKKGKEAPVRNTLEGKLPFVGEDVSVAALAFWRSMMRAPEMKMALLGPFIMALVIGAMFLTRKFDGPAKHAGPLIAIGVTLFSLSGMMQIVFNLFGWDREGFRAVVLSPIDRAQLLIAKNLSVFPVLSGMGLILFVGISVIMRLDVLMVVGGVFQILTATLILCAIGNWISITMPYRVQLGSLKPTKMPVKNVLVMLGFTLLFPIYMLPALVGPIVGTLASFAGSGAALFLNIGISAAMCGIAVGLYALTNRPLGKLLQQNERNILQIVTSEVD